MLGIHGEHIGSSGMQKNGRFAEENLTSNRVQLDVFKHLSYS